MNVSVLKEIPEKQGGAIFENRLYGRKSWITSNGCAYVSFYGGGFVEYHILIGSARLHIMWNAVGEWAEAAAILKGNAFKFQWLWDALP